MSTALVAEVRKDFKRSVVSQLRKNGYVPAVAYGNKEETTAISLKKGELLKVLRKHGRNAVIDMIIDGEVKKSNSRGLSSRSSYSGCHPCRFFIC